MLAQWGFLQTLRNTQQARNCNCAQQTDIPDVLPLRSLADFNIVDSLYDAAMPLVMSHPITRLAPLHGARAKQPTASTPRCRLRATSSGAPEAEVRNELDLSASYRSWLSAHNKVEEEFICSSCTCV